MLLTNLDAFGTLSGMELEQLPLAEYSFVPEFTLGDRLRRAREW